MAQTSAVAVGEMSQTYYQISDDDVDECEDFADDVLLEESMETMNTTNNGRGPYERAWTNDATRALIHIRGPMEGRFTEGRQKRTALWLSCTRHLQRLGYRYSAAKVQKKWHNILITYNKNLSKKYMTGYVHWEFFEDMFKYLQGKKADFDIQQQQIYQKQQSQQQSSNEDSYQYMSPKQELLQPQVQIDTKSNDEFDEDSTTMSELRGPKAEFGAEHAAELPVEISHANNYDYNNISTNATAKYPSADHVKQDSDAEPHAEWWKDYFERKLLVEGQKLELQREMHRELMHFNKMSLMQQEKIERIKIDAINSLTSTLQKLVEVKKRKLE